MKVIIAGSREGFDNLDVFMACELSLFDITEVVSGTARGVDKMGEAYGEEWGIPVKRFPADWDTHGRSAGYIRNKEMADYADALIALWDGESKGTKHMIDLAEKAGLPTYIYKKRN